MTNNEQLTAFWTTVAQVTPVFGLGVVVEGRFIVRSWSKSPQPIRVAQSIALFVAAAGLYFTFSDALYFLSDSQTLMDPSVARIILTFSASLLGLNPIIDVAIVPNGPWLRRMVLRIRHPRLSFGNFWLRRQVLHLHQKEIALSLDLVEGREKALVLTKGTIAAAGYAERLRAAGYAHLADPNNGLTPARKKRLRKVLDNPPAMPAGLRDLEIEYADGLERLDLAWVALERALEEFDAYVAEVVSRKSATAESDRAWIEAALADLVARMPSQ